MKYVKEYVYKPIVFQAFQYDGTPEMDLFIENDERVQGYIDYDDWGDETQIEKGTLMGFTIFGLENSRSQYVCIGDYFILHKGKYILVEQHDFESKLMEKQ